VAKQGQEKLLLRLVFSVLFFFLKIIRVRQNFIKGDFDDVLSEKRGIIPRILQSIFREIEKEYEEEIFFNRY
jgi:high-affinity nickel permease